MQTSISSLGCDPEVLLIDSTGKFISSVGLIGGSKDEPRPIDEEGNAVQEDNVTVEFNTPPCKTSADFIKHINKNKDWIKKQAAIFDLQMLIKPSAVYDDDQLNTEAARTFGCEPDFCAWEDGRENPRPRTDNPNLRSAGGHIHVQIDDPGLDILDVVKAMDLFVGCPMLRFDNDNDRRKLYGKAGAFRKKSYGVEYRTASNKWIESDDLIQWVWDQTEKAIRFASMKIVFTDEQAMKIQNCINFSNVMLLEELEAEFGGL